MCVTCLCGRRLRFCLRVRLTVTHSGVRRGGAAALLTAAHDAPASLCLSLCLSKRDRQRAERAKSVSHATSTARSRTLSLSVIYRAPSLSLCCPAIANGCPLAIDLLCSVCPSVRPRPSTSAAGWITHSPCQRRSRLDLPAHCSMAHRHSIEELVMRHTKTGTVLVQTAIYT